MGDVHRPVLVDFPPQPGIDTTDGPIPGQLDILAAITETIQEQP